MRRFGNSPKRGAFYRRRPGAYVVAERDGQVLLTHQSRPTPEFQLPGGGIDPGEAPIQALRRECLEETGWTIARIRKIGTYRRFVYMPEYDLMAEKLCHIFHAQAVSRTANPTEADHTDVFADPFVAWHALASSGDAHFLARVLGLTALLKLKERDRDIVRKASIARIIR